ncbi:MAG: tol-pal system protein YbgF [Thermodesulfovibrionales bacterium]|jgi:tol-pal system protein YbgF
MMGQKSEVRSQKSEVRTQNTDRRRGWALGSVLCALVISGCATGSDVDSLRNSVSSLQVDSDSQKKDISRIKTELSELSSDVSGLKEYSINAMKESQSSLMSQTSDLSRELQALKGRFDEYKYFMDKTTKELMAEKEVQQARISTMEKELRELRGVPATGSKEQPSAPATGTAPPPAANADDPRMIYDNAQVEMREGRYEEGRKKFEGFIKSYPQHALAPNAQFWIGETYYGEKRYDDAILSYETLLKKHPDHEKARAAMLKQAYSFIELGDKKTGRVILERITEKYPKTREADMAAKKLSEIGTKKRP